MSRGWPLARLLVSVALAAGVAGCAADLASSQRRLEPHYRSQRPQGPGPFPAVMLVPGCGGISPARTQTAERLAGHGYVVVFVDYLASRGLQVACGRVRPEEVADDIRAVSSHLRSLPDVTGVGVVGWSLGGAGVLASLVERPRGPRPLVDAAAAFYPPCESLSAWKSQVPARVFLAGLDDVAPPGPCQDLARSAGPSALIEVRTYPAARHSFDVTDLPAVAPSRQFPGRTQGYHAEAAREAWGEVIALFDREVKRAK